MCKEVTGLTVDFASILLTTQWTLRQTCAYKWPHLIQESALWDFCNEDNSKMHTTPLPFILNPTVKFTSQTLQLTDMSRELFWSVVLFCRSSRHQQTSKTEQVYRPRWSQSARWDNPAAGTDTCHTASRWQRNTALYGLEKLEQSTQSVRRNCVYESPY